MTVPTTPFASTAQIAYLMLNLFPGTGIDMKDPDFSNNTIPTLSVVKQLRTMQSAILMMEFANVGYKVPFEVATGESWPTHQTNFLAMLEALGVAGAIGNSLKPAPANTRTGSVANIHQASFKEWMGIVRTSGGGLRANYWAGSMAEQWIASPRAPTTEFTANYPSNYPDPGKYGLLLENLSYLETQYQDMSDSNLNWDYVYRMR